MKTLPLSIAIAAALIGTAAIAQVPPGQGQSPIKGAAAPAVTLPSAGVLQPPSSEPAVSASDKDFMHEQSRLAKQVRILTLQAEVAKLQKSIADSQKQPAAAAAPAPVGLTAPTPISAAASQPVSSISLPVSDSHKAQPPQHHAGSMSLAGVVTAGSRGRATILEEGVAYDVSVGSELPSGWRVTSIGPTNVELARGGAHRSLRIGG